MSVGAQFYSRSTLNPVPTTPPVLATVANYSKHVLGGPKRAELVLTGDERALVQMLSWLRYGVELYANAGPRGRSLWWGYIADAKLQLGSLAIGTSLDRMANRIAVAYTVQDPGTNSQQRRTTSWAENTDSIDSYGIKERLQTLSNATPSQAEAARDKLLAAVAASVAQMDGFSDGSGAAQLTLGLRGWWDVFDWRYVTLSSEQLRVTYMAEPEDTTLNVGSASTNTKYTQAFTLPAGSYSYYEIVRGMAKIVKVGTPSDSLVFELYTDSSGVPGTLLGSWSVSAASVPTSHNKVESVASAIGQVVPAGSYMLQISRSGAVDASNYYRLTANTAAGFSGQLRVWNGSAWTTVSADILFDLTFGSVRTTTDQIDLIYDTYAQFMTGIEIATASGVYTPTGRSGDITARKAIEDLLASQSSAGDRLTATVTNDRRLVIQPEPELGDNDYYLTREGRLVSRLDAPVLKMDCVAGVWARVKDSVIAGSFPQFIEEAEYTPASDRYAPKARDQRGAFDVVTPEAG